MAAVCWERWSRAQMKIWRRERGMMLSVSQGESETEGMISRLFRTQNTHSFGSHVRLYSCPRTSVGSASFHRRHKCCSLSRLMSFMSATTQQESMTL